jgi:hypothetical protein
VGAANPGAALFTPLFVQVGPKVGMRVLTVFLASYLVVVGPWIRVLAPDWSRVCFFGSMMCHVHVDSCVAAPHHVAWCPCSQQKSWFQNEGEKVLKLVAQSRRPAELNLCSSVALIILEICRCRLHPP